MLRPVMFYDLCTMKVIVFFDGYCNLCNRSVDFLIRRDPKKRFFFAPLQGETARSHLDSALLRNTDTVVLWVDGAVYTRSEAALRALALMGFPWSLLAVFRIVPRGLRDAVYNFIAERRLRWFGKRSNCRLPSEEEKERFL